eukprot:UN05606
MFKLYLFSLFLQYPNTNNSFDFLHSLLFKYFSNLSFKSCFLPFLLRSRLFNSNSKSFIVILLNSFKSFILGFFLSLTCFGHNAFRTLRLFFFW